MKTKIMAIIAIAAAVPVLLYVALSMQVIFIHTEPEMSLEEFHEMFDDEDIVMHFKLAYPEHFSGRGKSPGMILPAWGYGAANDDSLMAELRVEKNFGKYEFVYTCEDVKNDWNPQIRIQNPSVQDIDTNRCW
ncbi:hypothetical protein K0U27_03580 [archaeon]|nr:hypothetical protein [archaeon]